jgi:hypothetical protein
MQRYYMMLPTDVFDVLFGSLTALDALCALL